MRPMLEFEAEGPLASKGVDKGQGKDTTKPSDGEAQYVTKSNSSKEEVIFSIWGDREN